MRWFPIFVDLRGERVVVLGGGPIAERKIDLLLPAGPRITVISPAVTDRLRARIAAGELAHVAKTFEPSDIAGARFVIAATADVAVNRAVAAAARERGILVNVVDDADLSSGILPAIVDRSPLIIAIGTEGTAPAFARFVRARIESLVDESYGRLATFLARWRVEIKRRIPDLDARRRFYGRVLDGPVADLVRRTREAAAGDAMAAYLAKGMGPRSGRVQLVGAGPGDPGLLTLNALRALQAADVVLYDRLVGAEVLKLIRREAELIEVGKSAGGHSVAQATIHSLLKEHARQGRHVVRLKGGDPFVFGRGGEELEYLKAEGIDYEVVPGITAAVACAAYAGIPLTHRDHASSVRFVTAHCQQSVDAIDWGNAAGGRETLAIYMGLGTIKQVRAALLAGGWPAHTPVAFVERGSHPSQRVLTASLADAATCVASADLRSPALLIVGAVARFAGTLGWFGAPPVAFQSVPVNSEEIGLFTGERTPATAARSEEHAIA